MANLVALFPVSQVQCVQDANVFCILAFFSEGHVDDHDRGYRGRSDAKIGKTFGLASASVAHNSCLILFHV